MRLQAPGTEYDQPKELELTKLIKEEVDPASKITSLLKESRVNYDDVFSEDTACLRIGNSTIGTLGNFSLIKGKAKSRKTFFLSLLISYVLKNILASVIQAILPPERNKVLWFDTEQSGYHVSKVVKRTIDLAGNNAFHKERLSVHRLRPYGTNERLRIIQEALYSQPEVGIVVIDGIRDLVKDINNAEEATKILDLLLKWTDDLKIHIILILHENKNDNNARGHLGTELTNKAETVIEIEKDKKNPHVSIVKSAFQRDIEFNEFAFGVNEAGLPFIVDEYHAPQFEEGNSKTPAKANLIADEFHILRIKEAISNEFPVTYNKTVAAIKGAFAQHRSIGNNIAGDFLKYYEIKGWVTKHMGHGKWPVYKISQSL